MAASWVIYSACARPRWVAQRSGVHGVVQAVDQHQRRTPVVLDHLRHAAEILKNKQMLRQTSKCDLLEAFYRILKLKGAICWIRMASRSLLV